MFSENREINLLTEKTITPEMKGALSRLDEMSLENPGYIENDPYQLKCPDRELPQ